MRNPRYRLNKPQLQLRSKKIIWINNFTISLLFSCLSIFFWLDLNEPYSHYNLPNCTHAMPNTFIEKKEIKSMFFINLSNLKKHEQMTITMGIGPTCNAFLRHARLKKVFEVRCQTIADIFDVLYECHIAWCSANWPIIDHKKVVLSTLLEGVSHYECRRATITGSISMNKYDILFVCIPIWWAQ